VPTITYVSYILSLGVLNPYRRKGVASRLLDQYLSTIIHNQQQNTTINDDNNGNNTIDEQLLASSVEHQSSCELLFFVVNCQLNFICSLSKRERCLLARFAYKSWCNAVLSETWISATCAIKVCC
jgi:hypothetical protein